MRRFIYFFIIPIVTYGQQLNFTKTTIYKTAVTNSVQNPTVDFAAQNITYFDGFGKPVQQIAHQQSNTGKDIVLPIEYDGIGREIKQYLPYVNSSPSLDYNPNAIFEQSNFSDYIGQSPYAEFNYEKSSLNKIIAMSSPGLDWAMGSGHEVKFEYGNNNNNEVKLFNAVALWDNTKGLYEVTLNQGSYYLPNELYKKIIKDENWVVGKDNTTEEYIDKRGLLILKRNFNGLEVLDTYYVYDQFGNLTYVIPPKADMTISPTILDKLCYQYKYDDRNRLVEKKIPGRQWEFIVYDKLDRVVATGPVLPPFSNLSASGWLITKYDAYDRPILTAWMSAGSSNFNTALRKARQDERNNESVFSEYRNSTTPDVTVSGISYRYTNMVLPTSGYHVLTVSYYDDYNYPDAPLIPTSVEGQTVFYNNVILPKGLLTGKWIRASKTSTSYRSEFSYALYDSKSRPIRVFLRNHELGTGGFTQIDSRFNFIGQTEYTIKTHKRINSDPVITIRDTYTYSDQSRLLTHTHQINNGAIQLLASFTYDELGKVVSKETGNTLVNPLQKIDFSYNIRGWLTSVNNVDNLTQNNDPRDLFALKINYNSVQSDLNSPIIQQQYNGNISETYWKTDSDNILRKYAFKYDKLDRLIHSYYRLPNTPQPSIKSYDEGLGYDKNGNILFLKRNGNVEGVNPPIEIDDLNYSYEQDSNRLMRVTENDPSQTSGFREGNNQGDDYNYDSYGNLVKDENKGIVNGTSNAIVYNHLNLPIKIYFGTSGTVEYIYDALGNKLEKIFTQGSTVTTTKYLSGFQYVNDVLQFFPTNEGYVAKIGSTYKYIFQYKDQLNNVRLSYTKNNTSGFIDIIQEDNYYPFGMKHVGYNTTILPGGNNEAQKYKFNNKELQDELGLNISAMDFRQYDSTIGRFTTIDPLTENDVNISPYAFGRNNPILFSDSSGLCPECEAAFADVEPYGGQEFTTSTGAIYEFDELSGEWQRIDIKDELEEVVIIANGKNDDSWDLLDIMVDLSPIGDLKDIYEGYKSGNLLQLGSGLLFTAINVATLGSGSLITGGVKGILKAGAKAGVEKIGKEIIEEEAEDLVQEGIYEFIAKSGKKYVGQSGNIDKRLAQHIKSGKLAPGTKVVRTEVLGGKLQREIAEQLRINELGGIFQNGEKVLENIVNPIGLARQHLLP